MSDNEDRQAQPGTQDEPWEDPAVQERLRYIYSRNVGYRMWPGQVEVKERLTNRVRHSPRAFVLLVAFSVVILAIGYALAS